MWVHRMKAKDMPNEDWGYEGPDESVGIFGEEFIHEGCTMVVGPGNDEILGVEHYEEQLGVPDHTGVVEVGHRLTCKDCGAWTIFQTKEFVGVEEAA